MKDFVLCLQIKLAARFDVWYKILIVNKYYLFVPYLKNTNLDEQSVILANKELDVSSKHQGYIL